MPDIDELARCARSTLAESGGGTLHVQGIDAPHLEDVAVLLYEDAGRPMFLCEPGSPVISAADEHRAAVLCVTPARRRPGVTSVVLGGRLLVVGTEDVDGVAVHVVALQVHYVVVEDDAAGRPSVAQHSIPLELYCASGADPLRRAGRTGGAAATGARAAVRGCGQLADGAGAW